MTSRRRVSDAEIVGWLGDAPPPRPIDDIPDHRELLREKLLRSVSLCLTQRVSLENVQEQFDTPDTVPSFRDELREFVKAATAAHECWEFSSPQSDWESMSGRSGFALVMAGRVTHVLVTLES